MPRVGIILTLIVLIFPKTEMTSVLVTNIYEDGFMGANFHYTTQKQRMLLAKKFLNSNVRIPLKLLHRYIVGRADNLFFEIIKLKRQKNLNAVFFSLN